MHRRDRPASDSSSARSFSGAGRHSRETTPISSEEFESTTESTAPTRQPLTRNDRSDWGYGGFGYGYGGQFDPWGSYQWPWNPMWALQQQQQQQWHQSMCPEPMNPPGTGAGSSSSPAPVYVPLRGKRPRDAPSQKGKNPAPKRRREACSEVAQSLDDHSSSSESEDEGDLAETFDPVSFYSKSGSTLPETMESYVKSHFRSCLTSSIRKSMAKDDPLPDHAYLKCVQADDSIVDFLGKDFPVKTDNQLKRVQSAVLSAAAPPLNLWKELHDQGLCGSTDSLIPVGTVLEMIQKSLVLTGNASNYVSLVRRDLIISKMDSKNRNLSKVMKSICKRCKPEDSLLFGSEVHKALNKRAETAASLRKVASKFSESRPKTFGRGQPNKFFRRGLASDSDRRPGRYFSSQKPPASRVHRPKGNPWSANKKPQN